MPEFAELDDLALIASTKVLWLIKPSLKDKIVVAMEKVRPTDRSLVFHLEDENNIIETFMLSSEYFLWVVDRLESYNRNGNEWSSSLQTS